MSLGYLLIGALLLAASACGGRAVSRDGTTGDEPAGDSDSSGSGGDSDLSDSEGDSDSSDSGEDNDSSGSGGDNDSSDSGGDSGSSGAAMGGAPGLDCDAFCEKVEDCYCEPPDESKEEDPDYFDFYLEYTWGPRCEEQKSQCVQQCESTSASSCRAELVDYGTCVLDIETICETGYYLDQAALHCAEETRNVADCTR